MVQGARSEGPRGCHYCIVSTKEEPVADLCVLEARDDGMAFARAWAVAEQVAGWERVSVHAASGWSV